MQDVTQYHHRASLISELFYYRSSVIIDLLNMFLWLSKNLNYSQRTFENIFCAISHPSDIDIHNCGQKGFPIQRLRQQLYSGLWALGNNYHMHFSTEKWNDSETALSLSGKHFWDLYFSQPRLVKPKTYSMLCFSHSPPVRRGLPDISYLFTASIGIINIFLKWKLKTSNSKALTARLSKLTDLKWV